MRKLKKLSIVAASILGVAAATAMALSGKTKNVEVETNVDVATLNLVDKNADGTLSLNSNIDELTDPIYVTNKVVDGADGTLEKPYDFVTAINKANPGSTILLLDGTYEYSTRIQVSLREASHDGEPNKYVTVRPLNLDGRVIFDFSGQTFLGENRGIQIYGSYWHFYGIEVCNAGDNGMYIAGNHNIIENCIFYNNQDTGLQIGRAYSDYTTLNDWPAYNLIKNCTSFGNYDIGDGNGENNGTYGENADGFAAKLTVGYGNVFDGCIAFRNSDDGWDLFAKQDSGDIGTVILYNCASFENGFLPYKNFDVKDSKIGTYDTLNGDGIGFKLGGSTMKGNVIVENCAAWDNKLHGIGDNSNPGVLNVKNVTAFNNCAGVNAATGEISDTRGLDGITNKSNNFDLARSSDSYNNYYGLLSYVNNQTNFSRENSSSYNKDSFKGSIAYSILNTSYDHGEKYVTFTGYEDASVYSSDSVDTSFAPGTPYDRGVSDDDFKDLTSFNCLVDTREDVDDLVAYHTSLRNADGSVNLGDHLALADNSPLKTYADGEAIGATLNKESFADYNHYGLYTLNSGIKDEYTNEEKVILAAYSVTECIVDYNAAYQDFRLPKLVHNADIEWTSSNEDVITIDNNEEITTSSSVFGWARISVPETDTKVVLTAKLSYQGYYAKKQFEVTVKGRKQVLGDLVSTNDTVVRCDLYSDFIEPRIYALDASSISGTELPASSYDISYKYEYAVDGNSDFYVVDGIYTSVAGVFRVTATATFKADTTKTSTYTYQLYVVDPDCPIDFLTDTNDVVLSQDGFVINGDISNISGYVIATYSTTEQNFTSAADILALGEGTDANQYQKFEITTNSVSASFLADNKTVVDDVQYNVYYAIVNSNMSNGDNQVYSTAISVKQVTTLDDFYSLARTGKLPGGKTSKTTIYSLASDLDFTGYDWDITATTTKTSSKSLNGTTYEISPNGLSGLFRGNGYTISNITAEGSDKYVNVFYKINEGTVMDTFFDEITLVGDSQKAKQVGVIGEMVGGYVYNVHATNIKATGYQEIGGVVAKVGGRTNVISHCSLVNPIPEERFSVDQLDANLEYKIASTNKYAGGIVGNIQKTSEESYVDVTVDNCYVNALIGDGHDAGGNTGLIIGRIKGESTVYTITVLNNVAYGMVAASGNYNAGIVGDFESGLSTVVVSYNYTEVEFLFSNIYLNALEVLKSGIYTNTYAHKNTNPIVGRASSSEFGSYYSRQNIGSFTEYYSSLILSNSIAFDLSNLDEGRIWTPTAQTFEGLGYDLVNDWTFDATTKTIILTAIAA